MKRLSRNDIEKIAKRVIRAYASLPEVRQMYFLCKVNPELLLTKVLQLKIQYAHLSDDESVFGLTSFCDIDLAVTDESGGSSFITLDGKTVVVESDLLQGEQWRIGRKNFTLMHEGSHHILKLLFPSDYGAKEVKLYSAKSAGRSDSVNWEEWQVNTLASAILLPRESVMHGMFLFGLGEQISVLNKIYRPEVYRKFSMLADFLGVSKKALAIRMKHLGLLQSDYLDNPLSMIEVYWEEDK